MTPVLSDVDEDFADYVRARQHRLLRAAYLVCGDVHLAEDLLQGAFVKLAGNWSKVRVGHPDAYVRQILYRDAISAWRKRRREILDPDAGGSVTAPDAFPDRERRIDLMAILAELPPRQRAVIVLRYFEDRTERDTAEVLGISVGTVKSQTHDALAQLRVLIPDLNLPPHGGAR